MVDDAFWNRAQTIHFAATGRSAEFRLFVQEAFAINMTARLIVAAEAVAQHLDPVAPGFLAHAESIIREWDLETMDVQGRLCRLIRDAIIAKRTRISNTLRRTSEQWAAKHHPHCYLCGTMLDFNSATAPDRFTLDHIWPNCYGGDSIRENLLPCCDSCNSGKKEDYASWAACEIHSFVISTDPSENELSHISGRMRFALHNRAVRAYAMKRNTTMRDAYMRLGPWLDTPWHMDDDVGDFFNLANYEPNRCQPYDDQLLRLP